MELGVVNGTVRIAEHDPEWAAEAQRMIDRLKKILTGPDFLDFQHVGSTAIQGIPAKPIIDIAVAIREPDVIDRWREPMENEGFHYLREVAEDDWMFHIGHPGQNDRTHHIHFVTAGSRRWDRYINFRDYLNAVPSQAKRYGDLKRKLAEEDPQGRADFNIRKMPLILELESQAVIWRRAQDPGDGSENGSENGFENGSENGSVSEEEQTLEELLQAGRRNLLLMSRTANGTVDVSSTKGKRDQMLVTSGEEAASAARRNFDAALRRAWALRCAPLSRPEDIRIIIETLAREVNQGLLKEDYLMRRENSDKHTYLPVEKLEEDMNWFCRQLLERLETEPGDPVEEAAFTEFCINIRGHYFGDGCGKTSMASAAWVLMRREHPLPEYKGGYKAFYAYEPPFIKGTRPAEEEAEVYEKYLQFYRSLFL